MVELLETAERLWPQLTIIAAVVASHMSMPNHWLPYSIVGRAHSWSLRKTVFLTCLGACGHAVGTLLFVLMISQVGGAFISHELYTKLASLVMLVLGAYYLWTYWVRRDRSSCCDDKHENDGKITKISSVTSDGIDTVGVHRAAAVSLVTLTTLSPCVGSMPVLISILAPPRETATVIIVGGILFSMSAGVMSLLVVLSFIGASSLDFGRIRRHERLVLGFSLVILAFLTMFVFSQDHHDHHGHGHHHHHHEVDNAHGHHSDGEGRLSNLHTLRMSKETTDTNEDNGITGAKEDDSVTSTSTSTIYSTTVTRNEKKEHGIGEKIADHEHDH